MENEIDFDIIDKEFIEIYKRNFPDRTKMEQEIRSIVNVSDFHESCLTSSVGSIVYPKNMKYIDAKESGDTWNIGYPLEWLGGNRIFSYNIGDLVYYSKDNCNRYLIILSHIPFDDRYPNKLGENSETPEHFANLMDSDPYVVFEPLVVGIDVDQRKIIPDIDHSIDDFYTIDRLKKPPVLEDYLMVGEFLYYMKILAEQGIDGYEILNLAQEISKQVPDIGLHEINPIVTEMYEKFLKNQKLF